MTRDRSFESPSTALDLIGTGPASKAIEEIFNVFPPAPPRTAFAEMFTPDIAAQFLDRVTSLSSLLGPGDSHADALSKLDEAIAMAESIRDAGLEELFNRIRPIE